MEKRLLHFGDIGWGGGGLVKFRLRPCGIAENTSQHGNLMQQKHPYLWFPQERLTSESHKYMAKLPKPSRDASNTEVLKYIETVIKHLHQPGSFRHEQVNFCTACRKICKVWGKKVPVDCNAKWCINAASSPCVEFSPMKQHSVGLAEPTTTDPLLVWGWSVCNTCQVADIVRIGERYQLSGRFVA